MKTLFSTLLFTITVLHNFGKLSASESGEGSSLPHGSQRTHPSGSPYPKPAVQVPHPSGRQYPDPPDQLPHPSGSQHPHPPAQHPHPSGSQYPDPPVQLPHPSGSQYLHPPAQHPQPSGSQYPHEEDPNLGQPTKLYPYRNRLIAVWRHPYTRKALKAKLLGLNTIPDRYYKNSHNYISLCEYLDDLRVVVYIENEQVIGAELPPRRSGPTPNKSIWYINYLREEFRVKVNSNTGAVLSVTLQKGNFFPLESYRRGFHVETVPVFIGGIKFFVDLEPQSNGNLKILGAFVNPRED